MRTRAFFVVVALASTLAWMPSSQAGGSHRFTFYGSGWGHGVGMSQWGAYGLAREGWSAGRILTHFYPGTHVAGASQRPGKIRVGLARGLSAVHLSAQGGPVGVRVGSVTGPRIGRIPSGYTWTIGVRDARFRVRESKGRLVGGRSWGGPRSHLYVRYSKDGSVVRIPETGHSYGRGWVEIGMSGCAPCALRVVAVVSPEPYVFGISEVPSDWPMAALEAQAVAARTYAFEKVTRLGQHREGCDCGVDASTADQVYAGWDKEAGPGGARWRSAVLRTSGKVVTYHGSLIQAFFHSSSGGHTESNANVWGGAAIPYLRGVCDPGDYTPANPNRTWSATMSGSAIGIRIARYAHRAIGDAVRFTGTARSPSGRILATTVVGTRARVRISGGTLASALGLRDDKVWINENRNVRDPFRVRYDKLRCRPGLPAGPQVKVPGGTRQRFAHGAMYRNTRRDTTYWLYGPVYDEYIGHHESSGVLGMPRSTVERLRDLGGCRRARCLRALFEGGAIYLKTGSGRHEVHGRVFGAFWAHGGTGSLGFPTSDVRTDGTTRYARFERGSVRCPTGSRCKVVRRT